MKIKSIGIIGYGQFGKFLEKIITSEFPHIAIRIYEKEPSDNIPSFFSLEEACQSDIVFPCVPIVDFEGLIAQISTLLAKHSVIFEVCTVKTHPLNVLIRYPSLNYISTHPMFGPYSYEKRGKNLESLRLVLTDHNLSDAIFDKIHGVLQDLLLDIVMMGAEEHDKQLAETLFLTHYITQTICEADFKRRDMDTVSFGFLMDAVESVQHDKQLFHDVYRFNPFCKDMINKRHIAEKDVLSGLATI